MNKTTPVIIATICALFSLPAEAQFLKKLTKKLEDKVLNKVDETLEKQPKETTETTETYQNATVPKFASNIKGEMIVQDEALVFEGLDWRLQLNKIDLSNLGAAVKKYEGDRLTPPVDAYPAGYAMLSSLTEDGYLLPDAAQNTMVHIYKLNKDTLNFAFRGVWHFIDPDKQDQPLSKEVFVLTKNIIDKRREASAAKPSASGSSTNTSTAAYPFTPEQEENISAMNGNYFFDQSMTVSIKSEGVDPVFSTYYFSSDIPGIFCNTIESGAQEGTMKTLFTPEGYTVLMDMGAMKIKKSVSQKQIDRMAGGLNLKETDQNTQAERTGRTKKILDYTAEEYKILSEGKPIYFWTTEEEIPVQASFIPLFGQNPRLPFSGAVLEINAEGISITTTAFDPAANLSVDTSKYKAMGMNPFGNN